MRNYRSVISSCAMAFIIAAALNVSAADRAPNVILIMADDLGFGELGCYGQKVIQTPNIDRLAREGMRFTQFYSGNAVCAPSRCCLLTGKHPGHAYIRNNGNPTDLEDLKAKYDWEFPGQHPIPEAEITIAELLKQRGYATGAMGKWGLGNVGTTGDPITQGFDLFYGYNCQGHAHNHYPKFLWRNRTKETLPGNDGTQTGQTYSQDKFMEVALEFIDQNREQPFFLYLPFTISHLAIQVPEASLAEYKGKIPEAEYVHKGYTQHPFPRAGYAAMVSHMDRGIGQILQRIEELKLDDNTLVIFTSDNGPAYDRLGGTDSDFFHSAGPLRGRKGSLYEGGIRAPLLARWPGQISPGTTSDVISASWDMLPTIAEFTATKAPDGIDGLSLAPSLLGHSDQQRQHDFLYWEFPSYGGQQAVRVGDWKGVRQGMTQKNNAKLLEIELYDLKSDVAEQQNVAASHPDVVDQIKQLMQREHVPSTLFPLKPID